MFRPCWLLALVFLFRSIDRATCIPRLCILRSFHSTQSPLFSSEDRQLTLISRPTRDVSCLGHHKSAFPTNEQIASHRKLRHPGNKCGYRSFSYQNIFLSGRGNGFSSVRLIALHTFRSLANPSCLTLIHYSKIIRLFAQIALATPPDTLPTSISLLPFHKQSITHAIMAT